MLASAIVIGAIVAHPVAVWMPVVGLGVGCALRRPVLVVVVAPVLAGALAGQALAGARPADPGRLQGVATLVTDPQPGFGAQRAEIRLDGHRYDLWARGRSGRVLAERLAGETILIDGEVVPRAEGDDWLLWRHVIGRVTAEQVDPLSAGDPASRAANEFRRLLLRGADSMDPATRALFAGFVFGDDRQESEAVIDDFRASGLSHLLAVSGENVAFVLAVARPVIRRLGLRGRFVGTLTVLLFFALMTRFEPSVIRATAMAIVATWAVLIGRSVSGLRALGVAVAALVLIDPFLVHSVGFALSVGASLGIIVLARPITHHLPGPQWLREPIGITLAAQVGVAPVLIPVFHGIPVAGLPANVLAVPAAGPVMIWGLTGGVVAGVVGGPVASAIHVPTRVLLWWVGEVAARCAALPLGQIGWPHVAGAVAGAALVGLGRRRGGDPRLGRALVRVGLAVALAALGLAAAARPTPASGTKLAVGRGADLWVDASGEPAILVLDGRADVGVVLGELRKVGVDRVALIVARSTTKGLANTVTALRERLGSPVVLAPAGGRIPDVTVPSAGETAAVAGLLLTVVESDPGLVVRVDSVSAGGDTDAGPRADRSRSPPLPAAFWAPLAPLFSPFGLQSGPGPRSGLLSCPSSRVLGFVGAPGFARSRP